MDERTRVLAIKTLLKQEQQRPTHLKASVEYLKAFPQDKTLLKKNVLVGPIVGNTKPGGLWYTNHSQTRTKDGRFSALTRENINTVVKHGQYLPNRAEYVRANGKMTTDAGRIASTTGKSCPKRRVRLDDRVVVLSFCYPRGIRRHPMWWPTVVTAYNKYSP